MLVSMTPNDEVKTIHASLNDGSLRKWEFEPYTEQGKIELTDQDYATIQSIKGNTVKFNQLVQNGNFADTSIWARNSGATFSVSNNVVTITPSANIYSGIRQNIASLIKDHKYIAMASLQTNGSETWRFGLARSVSPYAYLVYGDSSNVSTWQNISLIWTCNENQDARFTLYKLTANGSDISAKNLMLFDLTAMGIDNLTTVEQVETWLSNNIGLLPYYDYTPGSLISFNGTGLKTENASQTESNTLSLPISTLFPTGMKEAGSVYDELAPNKATQRTDVLNNITAVDGVYTQTIDNVQMTRAVIYASGFFFDTNVCSITSNMFKGIAHADRNTSESVVFVANSTQIILQRPSSDWGSTEADVETWLANHPTSLVYAKETPTETTISPELDLSYPVWNGGTEQILPVNSSTPTTSSMKATIDYPDRTEDVNFLYKQTTFDSAIPQFSLVCKNQELPMTLNDGKLVCECDSSITNESGFFDCKVKMQDLDSVAYSQKIQLHVERGIND